MEDLQRGAGWPFRPMAGTGLSRWKPLALLTAARLQGRMPIASPGYDGQLLRVMRCADPYSALDDLARERALRQGVRWRRILRNGCVRAIGRR